MDQLSVIFLLGKSTLLRGQSWRVTDGLGTVHTCQKSEEMSQRMPLSWKDACTKKHDPVAGATQCITLFESYVNDFIYKLLRYKVDIREETVVIHPMSITLRCKNISNKI